MNGKSLLAAYVALSSLGWICPTVACEDIAIVSNDARYVVLDGETLVEKDVGNLWWLGIRSIDYIAPGSTLLRAIVFPDRIVDANTGVLAPESNQPIILRNLGRNTESRTIAKQTLEEPTLTKVWWISDSAESGFIGTHQRDGKPTIAIYDKDLGLESEWPLNPPTLGMGIACQQDGRVIIGGLRDRMIVTSESTISRELIRAPADASNHRLLGVAPFGCTGIMADNVASPSTADINKDELSVRTINLATNQFGPSFKLKRTAENVLFSSGKKVLQHSLVATETGSGGYHVTPTGQMRVIDVGNGATVRTAQVARGEISRLLCRGDSEKILISTKNKIYLMDTNSLSIIASKELPFERYFAF